MVKQSTKMVNGYRNRRTYPSEQCRASFLLQWNTCSFGARPAQRGIKEKASKDMKKGGEIIADGITVYKNGKWLM